ncbi:pilus assembly protein [Curvibacter cyanobacteriorum]|uniref:pilus assembly protein n=1 Tax=Curvibacter cyanobacteriorum TaxID=3026422 RepID=UPI002362523E|nr:PilC/PilY family type IV pilus protein [Curvibacter sp. HBC61]
MVPNLIVSVADGQDLSPADLQTWQTGLVSALAAVPDGRLHLAFQALSGCRRATASAGTAASCPPLTLRPLGPGSRQAWREGLQALQAGPSLSAHDLMVAVARLLGRQGPEGPYAAQPGTQEAPAVACRRSTHLLISADAWNGLASAEPGLEPQASEDGQRRALPDGQWFDPYGATATQTRVYRDAFAHARSADAGPGQGTLADLAFQLWADDAQLDLPDLVRPLWHEPTVGPAGLTPYWNPRNDPAVWQHAITHGLVSGTTARWPNAAWPDAPRPAWLGHDRAGDFIALTAGTVGWCSPLSRPSGADGPTPPQRCGTLADARAQDLWHMALNGRGRLVAATAPWAWQQGLDSLLAQVIQDAMLPPEPQQLTTQRLADAQGEVQAGFEAQSWRGTLTAGAWQGAVGTALSPSWDAATQLEALAPEQRTLWSHDGQQGIRFEWAALAPAQQAALAGVTASEPLLPAQAAVGQSVWRHAIGDRQQEMRWGGPWRNRRGVLGAVHHAAPWRLRPPDPSLPWPGHAEFADRLSQRPGLVFVAANGGALHAFDAASGRERMAYFPRGTLAALRTLADPAGARPYTVDGPPWGGDFWDGQVWRTALVGGLGRGGRGYFVLDVTDPTDWVNPQHRPGVWLDATDDPDPDLGQQWLAPAPHPSQPDRAVQITQLNDGRWAVVLGNGLNSASEQAVLLVQYLDGARERLKLPTDGLGGQGNGLSSPQLIDLDGDGRADVAYAGDLLGQMWKFDLSATQATRWQVAWEGRPLLVARDAEGQPQPITVAPMWTPHPLGGLMLSWGTGRALTEADLLGTATQSLYSVWDNTPIVATRPGVRWGASQPLPTRWRQAPTPVLVAQQLGAAEAVGAATLYRSSRHPVVYGSPSVVRGWFMDLPAGQRVLEPGRALQRLFWAHTEVPAQPVAGRGPCDEAWWPAQGRDYVLDVFNGTAAAEGSFALIDGQGQPQWAASAGFSAWRTEAGPRAWRPQGLGEWQGRSTQTAEGPPVTWRVRGTGSPSARLGWRRLR